MCKDEARTEHFIVYRSMLILVLRWSHLVVTWDGNVHVSKWGVSVAQGNGGDVDVGRLSQRLMVSTGVCHNQEAGLPESCLNLIGECTRGEPTVEGGGAGGRGKLQHCPLKGAPKHKITFKVSVNDHFHLTNLNVAQDTLKLQSWDSSPHGVSENPACSLLHTSDT